MNESKIPVFVEGLSTPFAQAHKGRYSSIRPDDVSILSFKTIGRVEKAPSALLLLARDPHVPGCTLRSLASSRLASGTFSTRPIVLFSAVAIIFIHLSLLAQTNTFYDFCTNPENTDSTKLTLKSLLEWAGVWPEISADNCRRAAVELTRKPDVNLYPYPNRLVREKIGDLSPFLTLTHLQWLTLSGNAVSELKPLSVLKNLYYLNLGQNLIYDLAPLSALSELKELYLNDNQIADITALRKMSKLEQINLANNQIEQLDVLANAHNLRWLNAASNKIELLDPFVSLHYLEGLILNFNRLKNLPLMVEPNHLRNVELAFNMIDDLNAIKSMREVEILNLAGNRISDISMLSQLSKLRWLDISSNHIMDIESLTGLVNLEKLYLSNNEICFLPPKIDELRHPHRNQSGRVIELKIIGIEEQRCMIENDIY